MPERTKEFGSDRWRGHTVYLSHLKQEKGRKGKRREEVIESSPDLADAIRSPAGGRRWRLVRLNRQTREEGNSVRYWYCSTVRQ